MLKYDLFLLIISKTTEPIFSQQRKSEWASKDASRESFKIPKFSKGKNFGSGNFLKSM